MSWELTQYVFRSDFSLEAIFTYYIIKIEYLHVNILFSTNVYSFDFWVGSLSYLLISLSKLFGMLAAIWPHVSYQYIVFSFFY